MPAQDLARSIPGLPYSIAAMLSYSLYVLFTRRMAVTESPESLIFFSALAPAILMSPAIMQAVIPNTPFQIALLLMLGFFGGLGHYLIILAYRRATTAALAPYPFLQIIWMLAFGYLFFDQFPDAYTLCGAVDHHWQRSLRRAPRTTVAGGGLERTLIYPAAMA